MRMARVEAEERIVGCLLAYPWKISGYDITKINGFFFGRERDRQSILTNSNSRYADSSKEVCVAKQRNPFVATNYCYAAKGVLERAVDKFEGDIKILISYEIRNE